MPTGAPRSEYADMQKDDYHLGPISLYLEQGKYPHDTSKGESKRIRMKAKLSRLIDGVLFCILEDGMPKAAVPSVRPSRRLAICVS